MKTKTFFPRNGSEFLAAWALALWIALAAAAAGVARAQPSLGVTHVPEFGTTQWMTGVLTGADPTSHAIALYIYNRGWWTKPTFAEPLVFPDPATGAWQGSVTTHPNDVQATRIAAFLVAREPPPPQAAGASRLPAELFDRALDWTIAWRGPEGRYVNFAGLPWRVKFSDVPTGPGENRFSNDPADLWVDGEGLHLRIVRREGAWWCAEAVLERSFGYGTYLFQTRGRLDLLPEWQVAGFFLWDDYAPAPCREVDFEYARWGNAADPTCAQFVVQPYETPGNLQRYAVDLSEGAADLTHTLEWREGALRWAVYRGLRTFAGGLPESARIAGWEYAGSGVPTPGYENFRINYWISGEPPADAPEGYEILVPLFEYAAPAEAGENFWCLY